MPVKGQPRITGRMIMLHDGYILLMERWKNGQHYFSIPGGGVEGSETPMQAAVREVKEETGIDAEVIRKVYLITIGDRTHHIFVGKYKSGKPLLQPGSPEAAIHSRDNFYNPRWVPTSQVKDLPVVYWDFLKPTLVNDIEKGFPEKVTTIVA